MRIDSLGLSVILMVALTPGIANAGQSPVVPVYVDENQTDPAPLKMHDLQGTVIGLGGDPMPRAMVSLFTEDTHTLVGSETTDRNGKFKFEKLRRGAYRVVARVEGLCPANIPIVLESSLLAHRKLQITMRPKDIDTCSYGMAK
jgi:protocatechuate 3,4-dioxygenase beta subunit